MNQKKSYDWIRINITDHRTIYQIQSIKIKEKANSVAAA
jgi:hypothetical protein